MLASLFLKLFKAPPVLIASMLISSHVSQPFSKGQLRFKAVFFHTHIKVGMLFKSRQQRKARLCCVTSYRLPRPMTERWKMYKQINQLIKVYSLKWWICCLLNHFLSFFFCIFEQKQKKIKIATITALKSFIIHILFLKKIMMIMSHVISMQLPFTDVFPPKGTITVCECVLELTHTD